MRHIILYICGILISVSALAQNQSLQQIVLTNGTVIKGQVEKLADGTIKVCTDGGDYFIFQESEVNRIIDAKQVTPKNSQIKNTQRLFLKDGRALSGKVVINNDGTYQIETIDGGIYSFKADEVDGVAGLPQEKSTNKHGPKPGDIVYRKGNQLFFVKNNQPLSQHDFNTFDAWKQYEKAKKSGHGGRVTMYIGAGSVVFGGGMIGLAFLTDNYDIVPGVGLLVASAGLVTGITGLIITSSSNSKLNKMAGNYNHKPGYAFNFGVQQHGIGLALNF